MGTKFNCHTAVGRVLMAMAALAIGGRLSAEELPTLASALEAPAVHDWPGQSVAPPAVGPALADEYLEPIADSANSIFAPTPGSECSACNSQGLGFAGVRPFYNRCGCDTPQFPWFTGPGRCDNWCVGPHWNVEADGMFIHREDAEWGSVPGVTDIVDQFDYGPGLRLFATGYNYSNYGLQIGYEGVNDFHSTAVVGTTNEFRYESTLNSLEINALRRTGTPLKFFAGFRYVEIDEDFIDLELATTDTVGTFVENRLIGAQIGAFRDAWQLNRWVTIEPFGNIGAYLNDFKREDVDVNSGNLSEETREFSEIAFLGEAGVTGVLRINACLALRGGYQVMAFDGVSSALETSLVTTGGFDPDQLIYHGARFGVEYQR